MNPFVLTCLGNYYMKLNEDDKSEKYINLAIKYNKNYGKAYYLKGILYKKKKDF